MTEKRLKELILRLQKAKCWRDENSYNYRSTRWFHLIPNDIDMAIEALSSLLSPEQQEPI